MEACSEGSPWRVPHGHMIMIETVAEAGGRCFRMSPVLSDVFSKFVRNGLACLRWTSIEQRWFGRSMRERAFSM